MSKQTEDCSRFQNMILEARCPKCQRVMEEGLYVELKDGTIQSISQPISGYERSDIMRCFCEYTCTECNYTFVFAAQAHKERFGFAVKKVWDFMSIIISWLLILLGWIGASQSYIWMIRRQVFMDPLAFFVLETVIGGTFVFFGCFLAWKVLHIQIRR